VPRLSELDLTGAAFRTQEAVQVAIEKACGKSFHLLGESEEGRPIYGVVLGNGPKTVSLIAGAHSDEPVGPETLRTLILKGLPQGGPWLDEFRFVIVPHVNPDGEARNREWTKSWPDPAAYLRHVFREPPGRDVEFGFPEMRVENQLVSEFLRAHAPYALHMSLHGMAVAEGAMLLIERHWAGSTQELRDRFRKAARDAGLDMHDQNRKGEKGFFYIEAGFWTTPEGAAMRHHFRAMGDPETAALFHQSSMEYVRTLGGDPLCLVTELPLFVVPNRDPKPGVPAAYLALKERLPELTMRAKHGEPLDQDLASLRPLELVMAMRLQLKALELGLEHVG
jgi:predicted deacylase